MRKFIVDSMNFETNPIYLIILITVIMTFSFLYLMNKEKEEWNKFVITNECKVIGVIKGNMIPVSNLNGSINFVIEPDKTSYLCNNGITYTR